jgi:hypothetical protein
MTNVKIEQVLVTLGRRQYFLMHTVAELFVTVFLFYCLLCHLAGEWKLENFLRFVLSHVK